MYDLVFWFSRNETSLVSLRMLNDNGKKVMNAAFNLPYTLRAEMSKPDGKITL